MTSEIKVDTISENTSANGVTIDGLTIKDGNIIGDVALAGTTPTFTIGDAGAEDASLIFDGNAQDFYVALDDSADDLVIGLGNTIGTTPIMSFDENKDVVIHDGGLSITTADNTDTLSLISTDADANSGPNLRLYRNSSSPANDDVTGVIQFEGRNNNSQDFISSEIKSVTSDVADGSEDGYFALSVMNGGSLDLFLGITGPETVINDTSKDHDFRVESNDSSHLLFVDGGNDKVLIDSGNASTAPARTLHVRSGDANVASFEGHQGEGLVISSGTDGRIDLIGYGDGASAYNKMVIRSSSSGDQITLNTDGSVTMPEQPAFQVHPASSQTNIASGTTIAFGTERFDIGGNFASNTFTAPVTGKYQMNVLLRLETIDIDYSYFRIYLNTSNKQYEWLMDPNFTADLNYLSLGFSILVDMDASDTSTVAWEHGSGSNQVDIAGASMWTGYLVC